MIKMYNFRGDLIDVLATTTHWLWSSTCYSHDENEYFWGWRNWSAATYSLVYRVYLFTITVVSRSIPNLWMYRTVLPGDGFFKVKMTPLYRTHPRVRCWLYRTLERRNHPIESHWTAPLYTGRLLQMTQMRTTNTCIQNCWCKAGIITFRPSQHEARPSRNSCAEPKSHLSLVPSLFQI